MAFKQQWKCENCNGIVWSLDEPDTCPYCTVTEIEIVDDEEIEIHLKYEKAELNERYRIAYFLRGRTWSGVQSYPWHGPLEEGRKLLEESKTKNQDDLLKQAMSKGR